MKNKEINRESLFKEDTNIFDGLHRDERKELNHQLRIYKNYISQVEKYRTKKEIEKDVSSYNGYKYSGQNLCFCEIRRYNYISVNILYLLKEKQEEYLHKIQLQEKKKYIYSDQLPIGKNRKYYAAHYRITIKELGNSTKLYK